MMLSSVRVVEKGSNNVIEEFTRGTEVSQGSRLRTVSQVSLLQLYIHFITVKQLVREVVEGQGKTHFSGVGVLPDTPREVRDVGEEDDKTVTKRNESLSQGRRQ